MAKLSEKEPHFFKIDSTISPNFKEFCFFLRLWIDLFSKFKEIQFFLQIWRIKKSDFRFEERAPNLLKKCLTIIRGEALMSLSDLCLQHH